LFLLLACILNSTITFKLCEISPWWWFQYTPLKRWSNSMRLHRAISLKAVIFKFKLIWTAAVPLCYKTLSSNSLLNVCVKVLTKCHEENLHSANLRIYFHFIYIYTYIYDYGNFFNRKKKQRYYFICQSNA
jgi:hypothetical protein